MRFSSLALRGVVVCALAAGMAFGNDFAIAGKWKLNYNKSKLGGAAVTYTALPTGEWRATTEGQAYAFRMDGKPYADGLGDMAAWKSLGPNTWQTVRSGNGYGATTDTLT